ncbi:MAG: hypothetical protein JST04_02785 [Bdellovibrionales bacterium]|nr:hypothetical protein [Bdellovibrionales bacterium]
MNGAHLHLLVNHVSLFALTFGVIALVASMKRRSPDLRVFAVGLFVLVGAFALIADETGEKAEAVVKALGDEFKPLIHTHEEAAEWAVRSGILTACLAIAMEWAARKRERWLRPIQWALLAVALHGLTVFSVTAWHGGKIRHSEIRE